MKSKSITRGKKIRKKMFKRKTKLRGGICSFLKI